MYCSNYSYDNGVYLGRELNIDRVGKCLVEDCIDYYIASGDSSLLESFLIDDFDIVLEAYRMGNLYDTNKSGNISDKPSFYTGLSATPINKSLRKDTFYSGAFRDIAQMIPRHDTDKDVGLRQKFQKIISKLYPHVEVPSGYVTGNSKLDKDPPVNYDSADGSQKDEIYNRVLDSNKHILGLISDDTPRIDFSKVDNDTKNEIIKLHHQLRQTKIEKSHRENRERNLNKKNQEEEQVETAVENMKEKAKYAPKSWLAKKLQWFRDLYAKWKEKADKEHDQNKIGFFKNILRLIASAIDFILEKLQKFSDYVSKKVF